MTKSLYLRCEPEEIGERVLLTGDPARVERIAESFSDARTIATNREFHVMTGSYAGKTYSAVSSGIGAPSAAIAIEELAQLGAKAIVRVGTTMGIDLPMGCLVLSSGSARFEATSNAYWGLEFPAIPDWQLARTLQDSACALGQKVYVGMTATYDAFYPKMAPALVNRGLPDMQILRRAGVIALDMETSLVHVLGHALGIATASICLITNNADPFQIIDNEQRVHGESMLIKTVLDALAKWTAS
ncbi:MAG: nucleoside phosphorylase [Anaerolineae bacterium]|nr:nucleoside phosphorylase [Anaerolineae bacterium]